MAGAAKTTTTTSVNHNGTCLRNRNKNCTDFSKVGGLSTHIELLREIIMFPLLYGDVYKRFNVKAPRGILFFGPPGTGKTLIAGALATELNRQGSRKVAFYQRKGADILDKWVGESERKLRDLFTQANRNKPSMIFFDELDGLAPVRTQRNDQVHCSVVATLLALMDGLDNMPGVVVIGATNRIDAIDPALRRPGRFDRELYFPFPSVSARKEILEVHTKSWTPAPSKEFLLHLAELTSGCCGSDLQALCTESVLCCLKRLYPNIHSFDPGSKMKMNVDAVAVEEIDLLNARMNLVPTSQRLGNYKVRKLSPSIKPLLQRQLDNILRKIHIFLPQFTQPFKKFSIDNERYMGRLVIKGNSKQGLSVHVIPAVLQALEHIPCYVLDVPASLETNIQKAWQNFPSILVLSRVDDWWDLIDSSTQLHLTVTLEDLHAGLPLLLIATCNTELPLMLQDYFYSNSSIVVKMEDPTVEEREQFFAPLFLSNCQLSVSWVLKNMNRMNRIVDIKQEADIHLEQSKKASSLRKRNNNDELQNDSRSSNDTPSLFTTSCFVENEAMMCSASKRQKKEETCENFRGGRLAKKKTCRKVQKRKTRGTNRMHIDVSEEDRRCTPLHRDMYPSNVFVFEGQQNRRSANCNSTSFCIKRESSTTFCSTVAIKQEPISQTSLTDHIPFGDSYCPRGYSAADPEMSDVVSMWKRTAHVTSECFPVRQLEMLYDTIAACISLHKFNYDNLMQALDVTLTNFENPNAKSDSSSTDSIN